MRITSAGDLLIGTTSSPAYGSKLRVQGGIETFATQFNTASGVSTQFEFVNRSASAGFDFYVNSGGTLATRITSAGNVGIGTSSTTYRLEVTQDQNAATYARVRNNDTGSSAYAGVIVNASGNTWAMRMGSSAANSNALQFVQDAAGSPTVRATIDTSGNLGLGVTPSAWNASYKALDIGNSLGILGDGGAADLYFNSFVNSSGQFIYKTTAAASAYSLASGAHRWYTAPSGTAGAAMTFTQAMTLTASGQLLLGNTTAVVGSANGSLDIQNTNDAQLSVTRYNSTAANAANIYINRSKSATLGTNTIVASGDALGGLIWRGANGTGYGSAAFISAFVDGVPSASVMPARLSFGVASIGGGAPAERLRINFNSQVMVFGNGAQDFPIFTRINDSNTGMYFPADDTLAFSTAGLEALRISSTGIIGVGVTPFSWATGVDAIDFPNGSISSSSINTLLANNLFLNSVGPDWNYKNTGAASYINQFSGNIGFVTAPSGTAGTSATLSTRMLLQNNGFLTLADNASTAALSPARLRVQKSALFPAPTLTAAYDALLLESTGDTGMSILGGNSSTASIAFGITSDPDVGRIAYNLNTNTLSFVTSNSTKMAINSSGAVSFSGVFGGSGQVLTSQGNAAQPVWQDLNSRYRTNATIVGGNDTTVRSVIGVGVTLLGNTVYQIEGQFWVAKTAGTTSSFLNFQLGAPSGLTANNLQVHVTSRFGVTVTAVEPVDQYGSISALNTNLALYLGSTTAAVGVIVTFRGTISVANGGTLYPYYSQSAASGGAWTAQIGNYMIATPLGPAGVISVGTWVV
jgi:hypothetical protein